MSSRLAERLAGTSSADTKALEKALEEAFETFVCNPSNANFHQDGYKPYTYAIPKAFRGKPVESLQRFFMEQRYTLNQVCTHGYTMPPGNYNFINVTPGQYKEEFITKCNPNQATHLIICLKD